HALGRFVPVGVSLREILAAVTKAVREALAVTKRRLPQLLAFLQTDLEGRDVIERHPLLAILLEAGQGVETVGVLLERDGGKFAFEKLALLANVGRRIGVRHGDAKRRCERGEEQNEDRLA